MFISDFAIKRPVVTVVTMLALVVFGIFALLNLKTDEYPEVSPPVVAVSVPYPGASPETVEREVVDRLEEAIGGISGVDQVTSQMPGDGFPFGWPNQVYSTWNGGGRPMPTGIFTGSWNPGGFFFDTSSNAGWDYNGGPQGP